MVGLEEHWRFKMPYVIFKSKTEKPDGWPTNIAYEGPAKERVESFVMKSSAETKMAELQAAEPKKQFVIIEQS